MDMTEAELLLKLTTAYSMGIDDATTLYTGEKRGQHRQFTEQDVERRLLAIARADASPFTGKSDLS